MFSTRNVGGVSLFLFGTTFLWLTPMFVTKGLRTTGAMWSVTGLLSFAALAGFCVATWGLFTKASWWEGVAVASAAIGMIVLVPYWYAARHSGESNPGFNVVIHAAGNAGVFVLLLVPALERWVAGHVMSGQ